jgi:Fe2+ or Zn2+ uptake regulation protein
VTIMATKKKIHQNEPLAVALETLQQAGFRRTSGRIMLLEFLICERGPFTIEEIRLGLRKLNLDLVTVYRCMRAFEGVGLVVRCEFGDRINFRMERFQD